MKNTRLRFIEQVARDGGPDALSGEIVDFAQRHLQANARGPLRERDVARAVDDAWRERASRLWAALVAMTPEPATHSSASANAPKTQASGLASWPSPPILGVVRILGQTPRSLTP